MKKNSHVVPCEQAQLTNMYEHIQNARKAIDSLRESRLINDYEVIGDFTLLDMVDNLDSIKSAIETKLDDRPNPFSLFEDFNYIYKYAKTDQEKKDTERGLKMFAEVGCLSLKYPDSNAIYLGGYEFSLKNTIRLHDWLTSVIAWRQEKGHIGAETEL